MDARTSTRRSLIASTAVSTAALVVASHDAAATTSTRIASKGMLMTQSTPESTPVNTTPTVVLVHGAFADASSWAGVIASLQASGIPVIAVANPLRGIAVDAEAITRTVAGIAGPVLLVGHSYGGAVITVAGTSASNVIGLVYVAAFALEEGETALEVLGSHTPTALGTALVPGSVPPSEAEVELIIDPAQFPAIFAADLPAEQAAVLAVSQRPVAGAAFQEPSGAAAWKTLPTWYVVATEDQALGIDVETFFAERIGGTIVEVEASHAIAVSKPDAVVEVIVSALDSLA